MFSAHSWTGATRLITESSHLWGEPSLTPSALWHHQRFLTGLPQEMFHMRRLRFDFSFMTWDHPGSLPSAHSRCSSGYSHHQLLSPLLQTLGERNSSQRAPLASFFASLTPSHLFWVTAICPNTCDALLSTISSSLLTLPKNHAIAFYFSPFSRHFKLGAFLPAVGRDKGGGDRVGMGEGQGTSVLYLTWNQTFFIVLLQPCLYIDLITGLC